MADEVVKVAELIESTIPYGNGEKADIGVLLIAGVA
jgi:hypothetical protein